MCRARAVVWYCVQRNQAGISGLKLPPVPISCHVLLGPNRYYPNLSTGWSLQTCVLLHHQGQQTNKTSATQHCKIDMAKVSNTTNKPSTLAPERVAAIMHAKNPKKTQAYGKPGLLTVIYLHAGAVLQAAPTKRAPAKRLPTDPPQPKVAANCLGLCITPALYNMLGTPA